MKVAIDIGPISKELAHSGHKVRGAGMYIEGLVGSLKKVKDGNTYTFFDRSEKVINNVDVVHYPYFEPFFRSLTTSRTKKTVVTVHDLIPLIFPDHFPAGIRGKLFWQAQKFSLKRVNAIITDSYCSKNDIIKITGVSPKKVHVVYLAAAEAFKRIRDSKILEEVREKYKLPTSFVLYVGDVTWNKNLPNLIKAVKKLNVNLVMVGKALSEKDYDKSNLWNADRVEIEKLVEGDDKIQRLGFTQQDDLVAIYNLADVFVMPSLYEGFGLPILEAMACGCPVVTSREGSLGEVAGDAAFYVDAHSAESIVKGVGKVLNSKKLQDELSEKGIIQVTKFTWKKTIDETIKVYKNVVNI